MKRRNPAFIILIFLFWYYSTIRERKKPLLQDIFHKVRVTNLTQGGLEAMQELEKLEDARREGVSSAAAPKMRSGRSEKKKSKKATAVPKGVASREMCTFLVLNISSLQLIPVNMIAYRSQYGSVNPTVIVGPGIVATAVSTLVAVVLCKMMNGNRRV